MAKVEYSALSPYYGTPQTQWYLLPMVPRLILPHSTDDQIVISSKYDLKPDMMSYDRYGTPAYWWVFARRNMDVIRDPIFDFKSGTTIFAPTKERMTQLEG